MTRTSAAAKADNIVDAGAASAGRANTARDNALLRAPAIHTETLTYPCTERYFECAVSNPTQYDDVELDILCNTQKKIYVSFLFSMAKCMSIGLLYNGCILSISNRYLILIKLKYNIFTFKIINFNYFFNKTKFILK
jgi:membrane-bound inhibitor of C-type lysozyme